VTAEPGPPDVTRRRRRADAEQNVAAILDAAAKVLAEQPEASVEDIARAAGVSRQTVYAHYPSRQALLNAAFERVRAQATTDFEAAGLDQMPPAAALIRLLDVGWKVSERYPFVWNLPPVSLDDDLTRHGPVMEFIEAIIRRGQASGDFDPQPSPQWLIVALVALGRAAEDQVKEGRMTIEEATRDVQHSVLRLFGLPDPPSG
jgi:AcrR family transcriptional regulator